MFLTVVLTHFSLFLSFSVPQVVATQGYNLLQNRFQIQIRGSFLHPIHVFLNVSHCCPYLFLSFSVPQVVATQGYNLFQNRVQIQNRGSFLHLIHMFLNVSHCCPYSFLTVSLFFSPPGCRYTGVQAIQKWISDSELSEFSASNTCVSQCVSLLTLLVSHCFSLPQFPRSSLHGGVSYCKINFIFRIMGVFCIQYMCFSTCILVDFTRFSLFLSFSVPQVVATQGCELLQNKFQIQNHGSFLNPIHVFLNVYPC